MNYNWRIKFFNTDRGMNRLYLSAAFCVLSLVSFSQKFVTFREYCGLYFKSMDHLFDQKQKELMFYNFKPGQTVASIGAQCSHWEAAFAAATDSVQFYLEDIDPAYLNERQAAFAWNYYNRLRSKPMTSSYKLVLGNEQKTNLPDKIFDKILIINSFHEFTGQKEMLEDISHKLKPNGILYIDEAVARHKGELHGVCRKTIYSEEELITILKANGYEYTEGLNMKYWKSKLVRKLYAFKKTK